MSRLVRILALREIVRRPGSAAAISLAVAAGVGLAISVQPTTQVAERALRGAVDSTVGSAALRVLPRPGATLPASVADVVRRVPGVAHAVPVVEGVARLGRADGLPIRIQGMPILHPDSRGLLADTIAAGTSTGWTRVARTPDTIGVDDALASREGLPLFGTITVVTTSGTHALAVGTLVRHDKLPPGTGDLAITRLDTAQQLFGRGDDVDRIDVGVTVESDVAEVGERLRAAVGADARVERPPRRRAHVDGMLLAFRLMAVFLQCIGLAAAGLVVFGVVTTRVQERQPEITIWTALGATPAQAAALVVTDAVLLGAGGAVLGMGLGAWTTRFAIRGATTLAEGAALQLGAPPPTSASPRLLVAAAVAGLATATVAALLAARATISTRASAAGEVRAPDAVLARERRQLALAFGLALLCSAPLTLRLGTVGTMFGSTLPSLAFVPATFLALPALVRSIVPRLVRPCATFVGAPALIAVRGFVRSRVAYTLPVTVLALAIELGTVVGAVAASFEESLSVWLAGLTGRSLLVAPGGLLDAGSQAVDPAIATSLAQIPGVRRVEPTRQQRIDVDGLEVSLRASGLSLPLDDAALTRYRFVAGDAAAALTAMARGTGTIVSESYAWRRGLRLGDRVTLDAPTGPIDVAIVGIVVDYSAPGGTVIIGHELYASRWSDATIDGLFADLDAGADVERVRSVVRSTVASPRGLAVFTPPEMVAEVTELFRRAVVPLYGLALVAFGVGVIGVVSALSAVTLARAREHVLLRAVGATAGQVSSAVLLEGVVAMLVAGTFGMVGGAAGGFGWVRGTIPVVTGWLVPYTVPVWPAVRTLVSALGLGALALALPALRAKVLSLGTGAAR